MKGMLRIINTKMFFREYPAIQLIRQFCRYLNLPSQLFMNSTLAFITQYLVNVDIDY